MIEDDLTDESDAKSDKNQGRQTFKDYVKNTDPEQKCIKCEFYSKREVQLKKHQNTKHANEHMEANIEEKDDF